ncbi:MAG TPA: hypothetical protein VFY79_12325 [Dehalococcoidia bacterium]|nr:hypothetical protein [Dehalococcoidia bacterium]
MMIVRRCCILVVTAALIALAVPVCAQTLGDVAKKEQARRKGDKPAKVYTNHDLKPPQDAPTPAEAAAAAAAQTAGSTDAPASADKDQKAGADKDKAAGSGQGEDYWHQRMAQARESLRQNQVFLEALQSRVNALTTDFGARDDPAQRAKVADDRQKALSEMDRVKGEIDRVTKQIADIEEEARRAGVPPGWLR